MKTHTRFPMVLALGIACFLVALPMQAQISAFSYQGTLSQGGQPANGPFEMRFLLFDAAANGNQIGGTAAINPVNVTGGLFNASLDFGPGAFNGTARWLEIQLRPQGSLDAFTILSPRQTVGAAPYALYAMTPAGPQGDPGAPGPAGPKGDPGNPGPQGPAGSVSTTENHLVITADSDANESASKLQLAVDNTPVVTMLENGRVGIGKDDPATTLDVNGTISATTFSGSGAGLTSLAAAQLTGSILSDRLAAGSISGQHLMPGTVGLRELQTIRGNFIFNSYTIPDPTPEESDSFAIVVSRLGDNRALIGAPLRGIGGSVDLFSAKGEPLGSWDGPNAESGDKFGAALAPLSGNRTLIGAPGDNNGMLGSGVVYLYEENGSIVRTIANPDPGTDDGFGSSVATVDNGSVIIGAPSDDTGAVNAGSAYLFDLDGTLLATFANPTPEPGDQFGHAVAAVGTDKVLVSAMFDDTQAPNAGAVYLFDLNGTLLRTFHDPDPKTGDQFGQSISSVDSDRFLIGVPEKEVAFRTRAGSVHLFDVSGARLTTFNSPQPASDLLFGLSHMMFGPDEVLISKSGGSSTAGYLFDLQGNLLSTLESPGVSGAFWSMDVIDDNTVLLGLYSQKAVIFDLRKNVVPGLIIQSIAPHSIGSINLADGAVTSEKIAGPLGTGLVPALDASKIVSGKFHANRIPNLDAGIITSGTLDDARLSANVALLNGSATFGADLRAPRLNVGTLNSLSGANGTIAGGHDNRIDAGAPYAAIPGGQSANAVNYGQFPFASGKFATAGDAQTSLYVLRGSGSASQLEVFLDGASKRILVPNNSAWWIETIIILHDAQGNAGAYRVEGLVKNSGGTLSLPQFAGGTGAPGSSVFTERPEWFVTLNVNDASDELLITISGVGSETRAVARMRTVEVKF